MLDKPILLSAIVVVGPCRKRAQRVLDALCTQTRVDSTEVIVVDLASDNVPKLKATPGVRIVYIKRPGTEPWGQARAAGVQRATSEVVAFIEEHCYPAPDWAEFLIEAHEGPWVAVGYAFTNANPETYASRAGFVSDYGHWAHPVPTGPSRFLAGNNISYKRDLLLELEGQLDTVLAPDFLLHEICNQRGLPMFIESRAVVAHENFDRLSGLLQANHHYCRILAAHRGHTQSWGRLKRIVYGLGVPLGAPAIKISRLVRSLRGRRPLWSAFVSALPVILLTFLWAAIGESLGYLFGPGTSERSFNRWELESERVTAGR